MGKVTKRAIIRPINGLRGLTAISVVIVHFTDPFSLLLPAVKEFLLFSNRIVFRMDLFFMLSGFMTAYIHIVPGGRLSFRAYKEFLLVRLIRLYPSYLAALLLLIGGAWYMGMCGISTSAMYQYEVLPSRLVLLQAWPFLKSWAWNYPTWFLSALWFAYLFVFPGAWFLVKKLRGSKAAYAWVFAPVALWVGLSHLPLFGEFHAVLRVSCEFLAGAALFVLLIDGRPLIAAAQQHLDTMMLGFVALMLAVSFIPLEGLPNYVNAGLVMATPLLLAGATGERSMTARFLVTQPLQWLGKISYALFITHAVSQRVMNVCLPAAQFADSAATVRFAIFVVYWAVILALALLMNRFVEEPCVTALKKWTRRRPTREAIDAAAVPEAVQSETSSPTRNSLIG